MVGVAGITAAGVAVGGTDVGVAVGRGGGTNVGVAVGRVGNTAVAVGSLVGTPTPGPDGLGLFVR